MRQQPRTKLMKQQQRAFTEGTVENINFQWIFFDDETDEASSIDDYMRNEVEVYRTGHWRPGIILENGTIQLRQEMTYLKHNEQIRIRKNYSIHLKNYWKILRMIPFFNL